jgi:hypothetical protein
MGYEIVLQLGDGVASGVVQLQNQAFFNVYRFFFAVECFCHHQFLAGWSLDIKHKSMSFLEISVFSDLCGSVKHNSLLINSASSWGT